VAEPPSAREAADRLPGRPLHPIRRTIRYWLTRGTVWAALRLYLRPRLVGRDRLPPGPAVYCFNHLNWTDPFVLMATLPLRPRLYFFGPKEEDMGVGGRNRLMSWTRSAVPYRPGKNDLVEATRRVTAVVRSGGVLAIAGEGRIHASERELLPLQEGPAYFALRTGVPLVPIAINGTSWLRFGRTVTVRVGEPLPVAGRPTREAVDALTARCWAALHALVADGREVTRPGPVGRWLTELFNDWPEGSRPTPASSPAGPSEGTAS
jgi:1-acyl-sn-glycerol-3-phosphate acyltransferase